MNAAYWIYLQAYFQQRGIEADSLGATHTIYLKKRNILDKAAIEKFASYENAILQQRQETIYYET